MAGGVAAAGGHTDGRAAPMRRSAGWTRGRRCARPFTAPPQAETSSGPTSASPPRRRCELFLGHPDRPSVPRTVDVGQPGDLMVLTPTAAVETLASDMVATTIVGGRVS